jgi:hypothetical protein
MPSAKASDKFSMGYLRAKCLNFGAAGLELTPRCPIAWQVAQFRRASCLPPSILAGPVNIGVWVVVAVTGVAWVKNKSAKVANIVVLPFR